MGQQKINMHHSAGRATQLRTLAEVEGNREAAYRNMTAAQEALNKDPASRNAAKYAAAHSDYLRFSSSAGHVRSSLGQMMPYLSPAEQQDTTKLLAQGGNR